jgi:hypothetical protein
MWNILEGRTVPRTWRFSPLDDKRFIGAGITVPYGLVNQFYANLRWGWVYESWLDLDYCFGG